MMIIVQKVSEYFTGLRDNHYKLRDDVSLFFFQTVTGTSGAVLSD